ncbi:HNH endonuclease signature motif containing protein, partial [Mycolicibacterium palauense]|uniref:HNH endonuclease signature motif containing protein n=1 Tax=Mycolicibacterium palauense TaxID=2034511 RepID=UPI00159BB674
MFDDWSDGDVVAAAVAAHRQESVLTARKLAAVAHLLQRRISEELAREQDMSSVITAFSRTAAEVAAALNLSAAAARRLVTAAEALDVRLPAVAAQFADGHVDWATVQVIIARTDLVDEQLVVRVDAVLAEELHTWSSWSRRRIIDAVDTAVATLDAEAAKARRVSAFDARHARVDTDRDGMARLHASLAGTDGAAIDRRLAAAAAAVCGQDPRTLAQRRADALVALLNGGALACGCGDPQCPAAGQPAPTAPAVVLNVVAAAATVTGHSDQPGYLSGFGVIDAELVRELARDATRRLVEHPHPDGDPQAALRYRPSAALARYVRARDLTCRFPGCTVPAERCDIDHTIPFNHADPAAGGPTVGRNLGCYCREHHRLKTLFGGPNGWRDEQRPDGTIIWTAPSGAVYTTTPAGADLFPHLRTSRRPEDQARVEHARHQLCTQRPANAAHRYRNQAARREIDLRRWRNHTRRLRILFHGHNTTTKPSTSPYMSWVNTPEAVSYTHMTLPTIPLVYLS